MDTRLGYAEGAGLNGVKLWPAYLCFIIFGILMPFSRPEFKFTTLIYSLIVAIVVGLLAVNLLIIAFNSGNVALRQADGGFAREAVGTGMLFMIPFTVLAILALAILGWNAMMPFASAAITTAAATSGTEAMKRGAQGLKNVMIPTLVAMVLSTVWMMLTGILP
ncbi:MAG: hypothetical protein PHT79_01685 [Syntrophomonadaceae bacterium]|nr:hypothetical protein [Syntrophomonadaceae bacterium]MDD3889893.1 hypothetical protein [Syntrophomonadaceae bacterium]MDD4548463.1 hypothetical protein [Syntrophomonadaceae bacterium]